MSRRQAAVAMLTVIVTVVAMTLLRLALAASFPMTNDEAYYWDWARDLQLSYFDHPPGVAWMTWLAQHLANGNLAARVIAPFAHLLATGFLFLTLRELGGDRRQGLMLLALTQLAMGLSLWGAVALPDTMLLPLASITLFLCVRWRAGMPLTAARGLLLGLVMGLAGSCKYHALPVCGGLAIGLAIERGGVWRDWRFWGVVVVAGIVGTMPVWLWNLLNDFASLRFQGDHGFGGLTWRPLFFARALVGELLLVTPVVFVAGFLAARRDLLAACGFLPLVLLITAVAPFKQVLPHWVLPAYWIVLPFVALRLRPTRGVLAHAALFGVLTLSLPWVLAAPPLRDAVLAQRHGDPGPLAELTLWPDLVAEVSRRGLAEPLAEERADAERCGGVVVVTQRWFWGAQLAFHLPGQPRVRVLDANRGSYYDMRDQGESLAGCPALLLADRHHLDLVGLAARLALSTPPWQLRVPRHEAIDIVAARGRFLH